MSRATTRFMFPIVIAAVLATAIFGFLVMNEPGPMMVGCFGEAPGVTCSVLSPIEHFAAHLLAFQSVSIAVIQMSAFLSAIFLLVFAVLFLVIKHIHDPQENFAVIQGDDFISPQHFRFARWIALHEKRDPSFACAMNK